MTDFHLSRRGLMLGAAGGAALAVAGKAHLLRADTHAAPAFLPTFYDRKVGNVLLTSLLDGYFNLGQELVTGLDPAQISASLGSACLDTAGPIPLAISAHVIRSADQTTLIDSGAGAAFGPTAGRLGNSPAALGIAPADVNRIVLTHMHPDHIGGLVGEAGAVFPNATLHVSETDHAFRTDESIASGAQESAQAFFALARGVSAAYGDRIMRFTGDVDLGGGLTAFAMPGLTPGHTGFRLADGADQLFIWGDSTGVAALQFSHPDSGLAFDVDGTLAAATRRRLLNMVAADNPQSRAHICPSPGSGMSRPRTPPMPGCRKSGASFKPRAEHPFYPAS